MEIDIQLFYNHEKKLAYLGMPKAASTSIREFSGCNKYLDLDLPEDYRGFTVIREPIERYVSGFIEVMYSAPDYPRGRYNYNLGLSNEIIKDLDKINLIKNNIEKFKEFTEYIIKNGFFEPHTVPQSLYLNGDKRFKVYKIEEMSQLAKDFKLGSVTHLNTGSSGGVKNEIINFLKNDKKFNSKVNKLYEEDIKLYNNENNRNNTNKERVSIY